MKPPLGQRLRVAGQQVPGIELFKFFSAEAGTVWAPFSFRRSRRTMGRVRHVINARLRPPLRATRQHPVPHVPLRSCVHGHVYRLLSRNLSYGRFDASCAGFEGIREKFGNRYLFVEYHVEAPSFATALPVEDLGPFPGGDLFEYLDRLEHA